MTGFTRSEAEVASTPTPMSQVTSPLGGTTGDEVRTLLNSTESGTTV